MASSFNLSTARVYFSGVLQTAMAKKAGNGLDIGTIVEDVNSEGMAGAMPTDVLVDAGTFNPSLDGLTEAFV